MTSDEPIRAGRLVAVPLGNFKIEYNFLGDPLLHPRREEDGFMQTAKSMIMANLEPDTRYAASDLYARYKAWAIRVRRTPISVQMFGRNLTHLGFRAVQSTEGRCWISPVDPRHNS